MAVLTVVGYPRKIRLVLLLHFTLLLRETATHIIVLADIGFQVRWPFLQERLLNEESLQGERNNLPMKKKLRER